MSSQLAIKTGEAFEVKVKPAIDKRERILSEERERTARYRIKVQGSPTWTV